MRKRQMKKLMKKKYNITPLQIKKIFESVLVALRERLYESILRSLKDKQTTNEETEDDR